MSQEELIKLTKEELVDKVQKMSDEFDKLALAYNEMCIIKDSLITQIRLMTNNVKKTR